MTRIWEWYVHQSLGSPFLSNTTFYLKMEEACDQIIAIAELFYLSLNCSSLPGKGCTTYCNEVIVNTLTYYNY